MIHVGGCLLPVQRMRAQVGLKLKHSLCNRYWVPHGIRQIQLHITGCPKAGELDKVQRNRIFTWRTCTEYIFIIYWFHIKIHKIGKLEYLHIQPILYIEWLYIKSLEWIWTELFKCTERWFVIWVRKTERGIFWIAIQRNSTQAMHFGKVIFHPCPEKLI